MRKKPIVQVDFESMQLGKFHAVDYPVMGEIGRTVHEWLDQLTPAIGGQDGSIGFSLPAAIAAWCATQDFEEFAGRKVVSISGDGGFGQ